MGYDCGKKQRFEAYESAQCWRKALIETVHKRLKIQCFEGSAYAIHGFKSSGPLGKQ
jgi:hypothetical protein